MENLEEKKLKSTIIYKGKIFVVTKDESLLSNGLLRQRDVVQHKGGVVILAEKENGKILLVQQYRYPTEQTLFELPAGKLDKKGETPYDAAMRELEEETGYKAEKLQDLGFIYTSPGFCTEKLYLYKAIGLTFKAQIPDEGEIINCLEFDKEKVFEMVKNEEIIDAKTICALMKAYCL